MSKIKTMIVAILVILSCASFVSASSVSMNLANENTAVSNTNTSTNSNTATSNVISNTITNGVTNSLNNSQTNANSVAPSNMAANVESVSSINDIESSTLNIGQILNIFLIAVGVILILLAIAILIRMKK